MVLLYCGTMPTHKLAQDDREGDETHTAVDGLMIVGGSTCTRSGVCECSQRDRYWRRATVSAAFACAW